MELHTSDKAQLQILEANIIRQIEEEFQHSRRGLPWDTLPLLQIMQEQALQWPMITRQEWLDLLVAAGCRQA